MRLRSPRPFLFQNLFICSIFLSGHFVPDLLPKFYKSLCSSLIVWGHLWALWLWRRMSFKSRGSSHIVSLTISFAPRSPFCYSWNGRELPITLLGLLISFSCFCLLSWTVASAFYFFSFLWYVGTIHLSPSFSSSSVSSYLKDINKYV